MEAGEGKRTILFDKNGKLIDNVMVLRLNRKANGFCRYLVITNPENTERIINWFRLLSDEYVEFDEDIDIYAKIQGPMIVNDLSSNSIRSDALTQIELLGNNAGKLLDKLLSKTIVNDLVAGRVIETKLDEVPSIIAKTGFSSKDQKFSLFVTPNKALKLWQLLMKSGKSFGIQAVGLGVRDKLPIIAGWPEYSNKSTTKRPSITEMFTPKLKEYFMLNKPYFIGQKKLLTKVKPKTKKKKYEYKPEKIPLKQSCLYNEHKKLGGKIVPFAGWEMPVIYANSSINDEHGAVRRTVGLFDVSHMGVFEFKGKYSTRFLDMITSNYVSWLYCGQAHYSYLFNPEGKVIDDIFLYRVGLDHYMMVVNAANAEEDWTWINAVHSKKFVIDNTSPDIETEGEIQIRNLKDPSSGKDQLVDLAIQGPNALMVLQALADKNISTRLARLEKMQFVDVELKGIKVRIARTGYTGAKVGYEMYLHPNNAPKLWNLLIKAGSRFGLKPTGLGARDSTRTEAGFPLHGNELAGDYNVSPLDAGYGAFVKLHKPYFIGRSEAVKQVQNREMTIVRFKMPEKGLKVVKSHDPVANDRGEFIGNVTSSVSVEGYQMGLAYIKRKYDKSGTKINIYSLPRSHDHGSPKSMAKDNYKLGDKTILPVPAEILPRFPVENELEDAVSVDAEGE
jgi:glycine hydroxymethyltransferase